MKLEWVKLTDDLWEAKYNSKLSFYVEICGGYGTSYWPFIGVNPKTTLMLTDLSYTTLSSAKRLCQAMADKMRAE